MEISVTCANGISNKTSREIIENKLAESGLLKETDGHYEVTFDCSEALNDSTGLDYIALEPYGDFIEFRAKVELFESMDVDGDIDINNATSEFFIYFHDEIGGE